MVGKLSEVRDTIAQEISALQFYVAS